MTVHNPNSRFLELVKLFKERPLTDEEITFLLRCLRSWEKWDPSEVEIDEWIITSDENYLILAMEAWRVRCVKFLLRIRAVNSTEGFEVEEIEKLVASGKYCHFMIINWLLDRLNLFECWFLPDADYVVYKSFFRAIKEQFDRLIKFDECYLDDDNFKSWYRTIKGKTMITQTDHVK